jgi:hypothetical protein
MPSSGGKMFSVTWFSCLTSFKKAYDRCDTVTRAGRTCPQRGGSAPIVLTTRTLHYTFNIGKLEDKSVFFHPFLLYFLSAV